MKILCLNLWDGGHLKEEITAFFSRIGPEIDVFCLQEVYPVAREYLTQFEETHTEHLSSKYVSEAFQAHQMTLVRKEYDVVTVSSALMEIPNTGHSLEVAFSARGARYWLSNVHGINHPREKLDTPERLSASHALLREAKEHSHSTRIVMGDFNLRETTESVAMFEKNGLRNLIKEYGIETTRNHHIWDRVSPQDKQMYSDYVFVGPEVTVKRFEALPDIVSDHQPLLLEIV